MTTRWFRGADLEPTRSRAPAFDAAAEGARHGLSAEIARHIWLQICREETDSAGQLDDERAQRRFHEVAQRVAARGGRLTPDPGRTTRVEVEASRAAPAASVFASQVPGRRTLVEAEASRAANQPAIEAAARPAVAPEINAAAARELPSRGEVQALLAQLAVPAADRGAEQMQAREAAAGKPGAAAEQMQAREAAAGEPGAAAEQAQAERSERVQAARQAREGATPGSRAAGAARRNLLDDRLLATFGLRERDVPIERESARPGSAEGVTVEQRVHLGRGQFDLESEEGRVRLGHEVAHVVQQQQGKPGETRISSRKRKELEAEAELAGHAFARGAPFQVRGRAPAAIALFRGGELPVYDPPPPPEPELLDTTDEPAPHLAHAGHEAAHAAQPAGDATASHPAPGHAAQPAAGRTADHAGGAGAAVEAAHPSAANPSAGDTANQASAHADTSGASASHATTPSSATASQPSAGEHAGATGAAASHATTTTGPAAAAAPGRAAHDGKPPEGSATEVSVGIEATTPVRPASLPALEPGAIAQQIHRAAGRVTGRVGGAAGAPAGKRGAAASSAASLDAAGTAGAGGELAEPQTVAPALPSIAVREPAAQAVRFAPGADPAQAAAAQAAEAKTNAALDASQQRVASLRSYVEEAARGLEPRLATASQAIDAAKRKNQAQARAAMARLRIQVAARIQAATTDIQQQHDHTVEAIHAASEAAQTRIDAEADTALKAVAAAEAACVPRLDAAYVAGDKRFRKSGEIVGAEAVAVGAKHRAAWMAQLDGKSTIMSGPVHDNRLKARAKAADQVAEAYRQQLTDAANKQADAAQQGKARDREALAACGASHRNTILTAQRDARGGLAQAAAAAVAAADKQRDTDLGVLAAQHRSTLKQIARKETGLLKELGKHATSHKTAIRGFVHAAVARCLTGVDELVGQFDASMGDVRGKAAASPAPDAEQLVPQLAQQQGEVRQSADATEARFRDVFAGAAQQIATTEQQSVHGLDGFGDGIRQTASQIGASITGTIARLTQHSHKGLAAIEQQHATSAQTTEAAAVGAVQTSATESTTAFAGLIDNLAAGFEKSAQGLEASLREPLHGLEPQIKDSADAAAKQVQPRWKKVLKVLVMVAVIVVVAVVAGPAVIGAVGAMAGALGASAAVAGGIGVIVGGAAVGAASGAVLQISNNVIDGNKWHEGVGTAMAVGAISGVFGGVGGLAAKGFASIGIRTLVTLGFDGAGSVVGNLATGQPITFEGIVMGLAIGLGMSVGMGALGKFGGRFGKKVEAIQSGAHKAGEAFGESAAATIKARPGVEPPVGSVGAVKPAAGRAIPEGSALAKQGRKATVKQAHEALAKLKLTAEHTVTVRNAKYQLTDLVDIGEGRLAAVAIVEVDGVATVQMFYRSNSQAGWRLLPATNEGLGHLGVPGYDKAGAEHILDLPTPVQAKLSNLAEAGNVRLDLHGDAVEGLVNKVVPRNRSIKDYVEYSQSKDYAGKQVKQTHLADPASGQIPAGKRPDFSKPVSQYKSKSAVAGEVDALVYESADGTLEYTVFKDPDNHIWIGSVTSKEAKITPLGVSSEAVTLPKESLVPLWEYHQQIPGGSKGVTNPRRSEYGSAWEFLKEQPDIQAWYKATGTPMPDAHVITAPGAAKPGAVPVQEPVAPAGPHEPAAPVTAAHPDAATPGAGAGTAPGPANEAKPAAPAERAPAAEPTPAAKSAAPAAKEAAPKQRTADLDLLYQDAEVAQEALANATRKIAGAVNAEALIPPTLKGRERTLEKINSDYGGDASKIMDLARSSIVCDKMSQLRTASEMIQQEFKVIRIKDRFANPQDGYRDILMNVEMPNGHIVEVQLHLKGIIEVKNGAGHELYNEVRTIKAKIKMENRPATASELEQIADAEQKMRAAYDAAYHGALDEAP